MLIKKLFLLSLSIMFISSITAFTPSKSEVKIQEIKSTARDFWYYFSYIGPDNPFDFSEYTNPNNYVLVSSPYDICEGGADALCVIFCALRYDNKPDFTAIGADVVVDQLYDFWAFGYGGPTLYLKSL